MCKKVNIGSKKFLSNKEGHKDSGKGEGIAEFLISIETKDCCHQVTCERGGNLESDNQRLDEDISIRL